MRLPVSIENELILRAWPDRAEPPGAERFCQGSEQSLWASFGSYFENKNGGANGEDASSSPGEG